MGHTFFMGGVYLSSFFSQKLDIPAQKLDVWLQKLEFWKEKLGYRLIIVVFL